MIFYGKSFAEKQLERKGRRYDADMRAARASSSRANISSPILTLESGDNDCEIAKLGNHQVGMVALWPYGRGVGAYWICALPTLINGLPSPASRVLQSASDLAQARKALVLFVADWLDGSGDSVRAERVRGQANGS